MRGSRTMACSRLLGTTTEKGPSGDAVCRGLVEAYRQGEANGGCIHWEDLDPLIPLALQALGKSAL